jgi:hypothetical protein
MDLREQRMCELTLLEERLIHIVRSSPELMRLLVAARGLELASWCIGAGAVRSLVWDRLHGYVEPTAYDDVDVVYYDDAAGQGRDVALLKRLQETMPSVRWEVTNQASIHEWFLSQHGMRVPPVRSLADGIATWPEYATCVGVTLGADDAIQVIAPHGLKDLFLLRVRHNPVRASATVFTQRVLSKRFIERWPRLSLTF